MRKGFTMIELIFVIVILGILAAVALPKLTSTATDAKVGSAEAFIGTLNRSVGPAMWSRSMRSGTGSVTSMTITDYVELPKGVTLTLSKCTNTGDGNGSNAGGFDTTALPVAETIYCRDGNSTSSPMFGFSTDLNATVQNNN